MPCTVIIIHEGSLTLLEALNVAERTASGTYIIIYIEYIYIYIYIYIYTYIYIEYIYV